MIIVPMGSNFQSVVLKFVPKILGVGGQTYFACSEFTELYPYKGFRELLLESLVENRGLSVRGSL